MVICLQRGADLHMAQLMPLPLTVSCFSKIQIGFTFPVPAHPGSPGHRAVKRVCVCAAGSAEEGERQGPVGGAVQEVVEGQLAVQSSTSFDRGHFRRRRLGSSSSCHSDALFRRVDEGRPHDDHRSFVRLSAIGMRLSFNMLNV